MKKLLLLLFLIPNLVMAETWTCFFKDNKGKKYEQTFTRNNSSTFLLGVFQASNDITFENDNFINLAYYEGGLIMVHILFKKSRKAQGTRLAMGQNLNEHSNWSGNCEVVD